MKNIIIPICKTKNQHHDKKKVLMSYSISSSKLCKNTSFHDTKNNILGIFEENFDIFNQNIILDIEHEYYNKFFDGIFLDFHSQEIAELVFKLDEFCKKRNIPFFVPLEYSHSTSHAKLAFKPQISGGNLSKILEFKKLEYGDRLVAFVQKNQKEFKIPNLDNSYTDIDFIDTTDKNVYFSEHLCTNYFTFMKDQNTCIFTIFDDESSLKKKIEKCFEHGISQVFVDEF